MRKLIVLASLIIAHPCLSAPVQTKGYEQKNSKCSVRSGTGEYPLYTVYKDGKKIFSPKSDGVAGVIFSQSGKYIALGSSEVNKIDVNGKYYHFAIVNCESEKVAGYNLDKNDVTAAWPKEWLPEDRSLSVAYFSNEAGEKTVIFDFTKFKLP